MARMRFERAKRRILGIDRFDDAARHRRAVSDAEDAQRLMRVRREKNLNGFHFHSVDIVSREQERGDI